MHWIPPDDLPLNEFMKDASRNILWVLDDIGQAHPQVQNALARVFHQGERIIAGRKIHPNVYPMATTNRIEDAAAVFEMPSFARMRVTFIDVDVDAGDWCAWAYKAKDIPEEFISFVHPQNKIGGSKHIFDFDPARRTNCSPRTLHIGAKHWQSLKDENAGVVDEFLRGIVCPSFPIEFRAHMRLYDSLPDIGAILKGEAINMGFCAKPDVLHLTLTSLIKRAEQKDVPAIAQFIARVPANRTDFAVWFYMEMRRKLPSFVSDRNTVKWALDNRELLKST